jgi:CelD/BcsL family acetyltransferase involved in cellulose biosynthesis
LIQQELSTMITVERYGDLKAITRSEWNRLVTDSATGSVFQTYEWHRAWWQVLGKDEDELLLLAARQNGELAGIAPLYIDQNNVLRFVGHGKSDYADFICAPENDEARAALWQQILRFRGRWRRFELQWLPAESPTAACLDALGARAIRYDTVPCPTMLIDGHDEFFSSARNKKSLRRHHNYFRKQPGFRVEHLSRAGQILPHLDPFFDQHVGRWASTESPSLFLDEANRQFYRSVTEHLDGTGWLRFTRLTVENGPLAFHFGFVFGRTFIWYKPSFDATLSRRSPGEALLKELFDLAAIEGLEEFDFTVGGEAFKQRFANHTRHCIRATLYARSLDYQTHAAIYEAKRWLRTSSFTRPVFDLVNRLVRR